MQPTIWRENKYRVFMSHNIFHNLVQHMVPDIVCYNIKIYDKSCNSNI